MAFKDLYWNSEHRSNLAHFASIASLAAVDGEVGKGGKGDVGSVRFPVGHYRRRV